jgi:hypothetical protein
MLRLGKTTHGVGRSSGLSKFAADRRLVLQHAPGMGGRETAEEWVVLAQETLRTLLIGLGILSVPAEEVDPRRAGRTWNGVFS